MTVIITGITGQDGYYMSKLHASRGDTVIGIARVNSSVENIGYWDIRYFSKEDFTSIPVWSKLIDDYKPDIIYNFAAQSSVSKSKLEVNETLATNILNVSTILEAIARSPRAKVTKFFQPSSSETIAQADGYGFSSLDKMVFNSPYAVSKVTSQALCQYYRTLGVPAYCGVLFPHESERRPDTFATGKFVKEIASIIKNKKGCLEAGNLNIERIMAYAPEVVEAINYIINFSAPCDFVVTNTHFHGGCTLKEFVERCFKYGGLNLNWTYKDGEYVATTTLNKKPDEVVVRSHGWTDITQTMPKCDMNLHKSFEIGWRQIADIMMKDQMEKLNK